jgi:branched-chain amino acid transport system ATP-binding protein
LLVVNDLSVHYGNLLALDRVSLEVPRGQIVSIIGSNGSGKSTLLKTLAGVIFPSSGDISLEGRKLANLPSDKVVKLGISLVPEGRQVFISLPVIDNLILGGYLWRGRKNRAESHRLLQRVFELFPRLHERQNQMAGTLSGGEQQMLAIGRALMSRPKLLMLDEPSLGLAPLIIEEIMAALTELKSKGTTIILVEQNARAALEISQFSYALRTGKVVHQGFSNDLLDDPTVVEAYLT